MNKARKQVVEVADLLSLESWDFSASGGTEGSTALSSTMTIEEDTSSVSLQTIPSSEDLDFSKESTDNKSSNVHVSVSGVIFAIDPTIFKRMEPLPWNLSSNDGDKVAASYKPNSGTSCGAYFNLDTSPVLFEMLLNFLMFGTFPDMSRLSPGDIEELEPLAALLALRELQHHLEKNARRGSFRFRRQQSKSCFSQKKGDASTNIASKLATNNKPGKNETNILGNSNTTTKKLATTTSTSKTKTNDSKKQTNGSSNNNKDSTALPPAVRKMQAALLNRRLTQQNKKLTHAEHCAMSTHLF